MLRLIIFLLSYLSLSLVWAAPQQVSPSHCVMHVSGISAIKDNAMTPAGLTKYQANDWEVVQLPDNWNKRWQNYTGVAWYKIDLPPLCQTQTEEQNLTLLLSSISLAGSVYMKDHLLYSVQNLNEPLSRTWNKPILLHVPHSLLSQEDVNHLYIRVVGNVLASPGLGQIYVGGSQDIIPQYQKIDWQQRTLFLINIIVSLTLGAIFCCIWFFYRHETSYGWCALASVFWAAFISNTVVTETAPFADTLQYTQFSIFFLIAYIYCFSIFLWRFLNKKFPHLEFCFALFHVFLILGVFLTPEALAYEILSFVFYSTLLVFAINSCYVVVASLRSQVLENVLLGLTLFTCFIVVFLSVFSILNLLPPLPIILPYACLLFDVLLAILLALRLTRSLKRIAGFNAELNYRVQVAEASLEATLIHRHELALKTQQLQERLNLAHELHDGLGGSIVRSMLEVSQTKQPLDNQEMMSVLKLLRNDLRQIIDGFSENHTKLPANPIVWLAPLRNRFVNVSENMGITLFWQVESTWHKTPTPMQCLTLYRFVEEALTNVLKHSQATVVHLQCRSDAEQIWLCIEDNGVGFNPDDIQLSGVSVGLNSMRQRIERLAGTLQIESRRGCTKLTVRAPF